MQVKPATPEAYCLFHEGSIALARVEANGIRIDIKYLEQQLSETASTISKFEKQLQKDDVWKAWQKKFREKANLHSHYQLGVVLFDVLGHKAKEKTKKFRAKTDESVLQSLNLPFVSKYLQLMKLSKARNTNLLGIQKETCGDLLHPFYNLTGSLKDDTKGGARTYRGSGDSPNFQNYPIRDKILGELIRRCFIPRDGNTLIEVDFSGIEVRISYCYHKDPVMKSYLLDKTKDMHRDMAAQCYMLPIDEVTKNTRYCGKNQFVFPQFYGDDYLKCSKHLWESIAKMELATVSGQSLMEVLKSKGIKRLGNQDREEKQPSRGTFERHIKEVQEDFWGRRFKVYTAWKKAWYDKYREKCWFRMKTGFVCQGLYRKNQVINYPVQGAAFHCLLWTIIELQKWIDKYKLKTKIVGQIHDSILLDSPEHEKEFVIHKMHKLMTKQLPAAWPWIIIPLEVEIDTTTTNWHEKAPYALAT